jgi:hypothetical protein
VRSLIAREWRESRTLLLTAVALVFLLAAALPLLPGRGGAQLARVLAIVFTPVVTVLFAVAAGADLVAAETGSGRIAFLAALPVRPAKLWAAKAVYLFLALLLFTAAAAAADAILLATTGDDPRRVLPGSGGGVAVALVAGAACGAAVLFWSTLLDRGIAAAGATIATAFAIGVMLAPYGEILRARKIENSVGLLYSVAGVLTAGFATGSFLAFTRGRIHLPAHGRRAALAVGAFLLCAVPPAAAARASIGRWQSISPADGNLAIWFCAATPDGRWAIVRASHRGRHWSGLAPPTRLWAVRTDGHGFVDLTSYVDPTDPRIVTENGSRVLALRHGELPRPRVSVPILSDVDLDPGRATSQRALTRADEAEFLVRTRDRMVRHEEFPAGNGHYYGPGPRARAGLPAAPGFDPEGRPFELSPDRARAVLLGAGRTPVLVTGRGATPLAVPAGAHPRARWSIDGGRFLLRSGGGTWVATVGDAGARLARVDLPPLAGRFEAFAGETLYFVEAGPEGDRLLATRLGGATVRLLPGGGK